MKKTIALCFLFVFILVKPALSDYNGEISIGNIRGDIIIRSETDGNIQLDRGNYPVFKGDRIITKNGSGELTMLSGASIKILEDSSIQVIDLNPVNVSMKVEFGSFYVRCSDISRLDITLTNAKITCNTRTVFFFKQESNDTFRINVHSGSLSINKGNQYHTLKTGDDVLFDRFTTRRLVDTNPARWETYDYGYQGSYSSPSYLPREISVYASSFDRYGRWVYLSEYGYCWTPTSVNISIWSPFSCGKYIRRHGRDIWISCEPWGWVPHHYGRWVSHSYYGWLWVPPSRQRAVWQPFSVFHHERQRDRVYIREHYHKPPVVIDRDRRHLPPPQDRYPSINRNDYRNDRNIKPPFNPDTRDRDFRNNNQRHDRLRNDFDNRRPHPNIRNTHEKPNSARGL